MAGNKKELKFSAGIDLSGFDADIQKIQNKMRQLKSSMDAMASQEKTSSKLSGVGLGTPMTPAARAEYERFSQKNKRDMDQLIRDQIQANERLKKVIDDRKKIEDSLNKTLDSRIKGSKEYLELEQKISRQKENTYRLEQRYIQQNKALGDSIGGGGRGPISPSNIVGGLATASIAAKVVEGIANISQVTSRAQGSATQGILGNDLSQLAAGRVVDMYANMPERLKAQQMAAKFLETKKYTSGLGVVGSAVSSFGSGNFSTGMYGLAAAGSSLMDNVSGITKYTGGESALTGKFRGAYESKLMEDYAANYQANLEAEKRKNPLKQLATSYLQENYARDLGFQRSTGLSDDRLYGRRGFLENANLSGFTGDLAMQQASGILAAGGSTRAATGSSLLGLQSGRGFDQTNAGDILAKISMSAGSSDVTNSIYKRMLAESFTDGLDSSELRAEQRKYMEISAAAIVSSGATTGMDAERVSSMIRGAMSGQADTMAGLQAASGAFEQYKNIQAQSGGREGAIDYAIQLSDPVLSKLSPGISAALMGASEDQLTSTHPAVIAAAAESGSSVEDVLSAISGAKTKKAQYTTGYSTQSAEKLRAFTQEKGRAPTLEELRENPELASAYSEEVKSTLIAQGGRTGTAQQFSAMANLVRGQRGAAATPENMGYIETKLGVGQERGADNVISQMGQVSQVFLENFRNFKETITPTGEALDNLTRKLVLLSEVASSFGDKDRASALKAAQESIMSTLQKSTKAPTQPVAVKDKRQ